MPRLVQATPSQSAIVIAVGVPCAIATRLRCAAIAVTRPGAPAPNALQVAVDGV
jgi:hypothetical protein